MTSEYPENEATQELSTHEKQANEIPKKKKKPRYSKAKKRELKQQRLEEEELRKKSKKRKRPRGKLTPKTIEDPPKDAIDRILRCAKNSIFTDSVVVENREDSETTNENELMVEIHSGCNLSEHDQASSLPPSAVSGQKLFRRTICTIRVQPLLVLDLNGILCHRDRKRLRREGVQLRPSLGKVANTDIIPRTDLLKFLKFLDKHFCLAIWTSAKPKTAKKLLNLLLSGNSQDAKNIRSRLLFVWSQSQCTIARNEDAKFDSRATLPTQGEDDEQSFDDQVVFEKHLPKIWETYPLWSANNTLLMDDSPEKCPLAVGNAVHPHALDGTSMDKATEERQMSFFQKLVSFWIDCSHLERVDGSFSNTKYYGFLQKHATGYMGWRDPGQIVERQLL